MAQCIIFDCDGTLVDSELLCNLGLEIKLREYGVELSANKMMEKFRGRKLALILDTIEKEYNIKIKQDFVPTYRSLVEVLFEENLKPNDGVAKLLATIDLPVCVASSGPLRKINKALTLTGLAHYFNENVFSSYEINSWKPEPDIFLHAAKAMGVPAQNCIVVEDSPVGILAAQRARMRPILYDPSVIYPRDDGVVSIQHMSELKDMIVC